MFTNVVIPVREISAVGEARRASARLAEAAGMGETDRGRLAIVVTELATNLVRHARGGGELLLGATAVPGGVPGGAGPFVEVVVTDTGPGMPDVRRCFDDGFSTGGTPGTGLGAVRRLSESLDVYSAASGTTLWVRVGSTDSSGTRDDGCRVGGLSVPAPGETACGDAWRVAGGNDGLIALLVIDGLGHGPLAAGAAQAGCDSFAADPFAAPRAVVERMHRAMAGTRGAAVAVARLDPVAGTLAYAAVGNIAGTLLGAGGASRGLFSHNGTVGHQVRKVQEFEYPWAADSRLVLHSDGLQTRWALDRYPGLAARHPAVLAGVLYRDFRRGRDDATVVAVGPFGGGML